MPFTPFHFGPGALLHSAAPKHVSFLAFCGANVLVDVEPLYFMLTHQYPIHRFFHTYVGATVAAAIAGTYSHVLLDSLMHADMKPFAPFSAANPLLGAVFLNTLHGFCVLAGVVGGVVIAVRHLFRGRAKPS